MEHKGIEYQIVQDECPESPREWDNVATLALFHRRYNFANETHLNSGNYSGWGEMKEDIISTYKPVYITPVYARVHSGIALSDSPFSDPWDSGQVGYAFITPAVAAEFGNDAARYTQAVANELKVYQNYLNGEVYGYQIESLNESSYGYYSQAEAEAAAKEMIDWFVMQGEISEYQHVNDFIE